MKLFCWTSETFKDYENGYLIAIGKDAEEAKNYIRSQFKTEIFDKFPHLDINDKEKIELKFQEIEADLMKAPDIIEKRSLLILGSA